MANTDYKPICMGGGGGGECAWIITTSDKLPKTGVEGKIYLCIDNGQWYGWINDGYQEIGTGAGRQKYSFPTGRQSFPAIGKQGQYYIDEITGETYIWDSSFGRPIFRLPNWITTPWTQGLPNNVICTYKGTIVYKEGTDAKGKYIRGTWPADDSMGQHTTMQINFKDPVNPSAGVVQAKVIQPMLCYLDPDNPVVDFSQFPIPFGETFVIFVAKTYNLSKWNSDNLKRFAQTGSYNFAFYLTDQAEGSYIKVK